MATWEPYVDRPEWFGRFYLGFDEVDRLIAQTFRSGEQLLFHTSGDRAADNLFLALFDLNGNRSLRPLRPRLEHGDLIAPYQLKRISGLGIVVVHNPTHSNSVVPARVGPEFQRIQPLRSLLNAGIPIAFGSDGPGAGPLNPFLNLQAAVAHPANPYEALTREEAVIAYTAGSAYAEMAEKQKGTLAPGMLADVAVLSQDIFTISLQQFPDVRSVLTMVGGRIVYQSEMSFAVKP
jgi:predicted amidohydrolase YtcJ